MWVYLDTNHQLESRFAAPLFPLSRGGSEGGFKVDYKGQQCWINGAEIVKQAGESRVTDIMQPGSLPKEGCTCILLS